MKIEIKTDVFAATSLFRAVKDIRYYLNGLYLETGPDGARLVASDGHAMAVARIDGEFPAASVILPTALVEAVKCKAKSPLILTLEFDEDTCCITDDKPAREIALTFGDQRLIGKEIDGKFPDFRRVVPTEASGEVAQFDPKYTSRIQKASEVLGNKRFPGIAHNGTSGSFSVVRDDFLVIVMALRAEPEMITPGWVAAALNFPPAKLRRAA